MPMQSRVLARMRKNQKSSMISPLCHWATGENIGRELAVFLTILALIPMPTPGVGRLIGNPGLRLEGFRFPPEYEAVAPAGRVSASRNSVVHVNVHIGSMLRQGMREQADHDLFKQFDVVDIIGQHLLHRRNLPGTADDSHPIVFLHLVLSVLDAEHAAQVFEFLGIESESRAGNLERVDEPGLRDWRKTVMEKTAVDKVEIELVDVMTRDNIRLQQELVENSDGNGVVVDAFLKPLAVVEDAGCTDLVVFVVPFPRDADERPLLENIVDGDVLFVDAPRGDDVGKYLDVEKENSWLVHIASLFPYEPPHSQGATV